MCHQCTRHQELHAPLQRRIHRYVTTLILNHHHLHADIYIMDAIYIVRMWMLGHARLPCSIHRRITHSLQLPKSATSQLRLHL